MSDSFRKTVRTLLLAAFLLAVLPKLSLGTKKILSFGMTRAGTDASSLAHANHKRRFLHHVPTFKDYSKMKYQNDGVFYTHISLGGVAGKQQTFSAILDTGSATIALPCSGCTECGDHHGQYDISESPTAKMQSQRYIQCYAEGSCNTGTTVKDNVCFGEDCPVSESAPINFGCCDNYSPMFQAQTADGIIGVGPGSNLVKHLHDLHRLESYEFAICLDNNDGRFSVGGYSEKLHTGPMQWTTLDVDMEGHYENIVESISISGGKKFMLPIHEQQTLFDSGTTFTYVTSHIFQELQRIFKRACKAPEACDGTEDKFSSRAQKLLACYKKLTPEKKKTFPTLELSFAEGLVHKVTPDMYFFESGDMSCVGVFDDPQQTFTLGANFMRGHDIVYDVGKKKLGIAPSVCTKIPEGEKGPEYDEEEHDGQPSSSKGKVGHKKTKGSLDGGTKNSLDEGTKNSQVKKNKARSPIVIFGAATAGIVLVAGLVVLFRRKRGNTLSRENLIEYTELSNIPTEVVGTSSSCEYAPPLVTHKMP